MLSDHIHTNLMCIDFFYCSFLKGNRKSQLLLKLKAGSSQNASYGSWYANPDSQPADFMKHAMLVGSLLPKPWLLASWGQLLRQLPWNEVWPWNPRDRGSMQIFVTFQWHRAESSSTLMHLALGLHPMPKSSTLVKCHRLAWQRSRLAMWKVSHKLKTWPQLKAKPAYERLTSTIIRYKDNKP